MKQKRKFWQKLAIFITAMFATLFGYSQPKVLSIEAQKTSALDVQERLNKVREQLELNRRETKDEVQTTDSLDNQPENLSRDSEQTLVQWRDWYNRWRDWSNY